MSLTYHPSVEQSINSFKQHLPQTSLLTGKKGVGLKTLALHFSGSDQTRVLGPEYLTKASTVPQIGVETVRKLYEDTRTKSDTKNIIIIDDADMMTIAAQNSFLKLLEEPNQHTFFILTTHFPERLLPTVRSRSQILNIPPLQRAESLLFVNSLGSLGSVKKKQIAFVANGLPAEMVRLAGDSDYYDKMVSQTMLAKQLVEARRQDVLPMILRNTLDRSAALLLIERMLYLLGLKPTPASVERTKKVLDAYESVRLGGNIRLQLAEAMV